MLAVMLVIRGIRGYGAILAGYGAIRVITTYRGD